MSKKTPQITHLAVCRPRIRTGNASRSSLGVQAVVFRCLPAILTVGLGHGETETDPVAMASDRHAFDVPPAARTCGFAPALHAGLDRDHLARRRSSHALTLGSTRRGAPAARSAPCRTFDRPSQTVADLLPNVAYPASTSGVGEAGSSNDASNAGSGSSFAGGLCCRR